MKSPGQPTQFVAEQLLTCSIQHLEIAAPILRLHNRHNSDSKWGRSHGDIHHCKATAKVAAIASVSMKHWTVTDPAASRVPGKSQA